jgi:Ser/Thr protein kinase RdoA (MazF antagonist)
MNILNEVLASYGLSSQAIIQPINGGLINSTWKIVDGEKELVLQQINTGVFKHPQLIAENTQLLHQHLASIRSDYFLVSAIPTKNGSLLLEKVSKVFRLLPFVKNSHTISVVQTPEQAYEASFQFGLFTKVFERFDPRTLHVTIPHFHDLSLRYKQFETSVAAGNRERVAQCASEIELLQSFFYLVKEYEAFVGSPHAKLRVTHHDTKISNVLFNDLNKGICVIDLDTVMPGYFFSDVGDMMRTYLSPAGEEERDLTKLMVRSGFFMAIAEGYFSAMGDAFSQPEREAFAKSGLWLTYMQALRFLTDYLNSDVYYGAEYQHQNLVRARNQSTLLYLIDVQIKEFQSIVSKL